MSYSVDLYIDTGGDEPAYIGPDINYTSNCAEMWRHAGVDLRLLKDAPCSEAAGPLTEAVKQMRENPATYRAMNPPNGWGDYEGALEFLSEIADACVNNPKASLYVSF